MSKSKSDQISLENVKKVIEIFINELKTKGFALFQNQPTVEVFFKGEKFVGVSLIDENNEEINCRLNNNPRPGKVYLYFPIEQLNDDHALPFLGKTNTYRYLQQMKAKNAYNINLERVDNLLEDAHYSVALVFLVSAFENISKDLFFLHHELWFSQELEEVDKFSDEILKKIGTIIDPKIKEDFKNKYFSYYDTVDGKIIGIEREKFTIAEKWRNLRKWELIHKVCRDLGIYNKYIQKKMGNQGKEIGRFELLKEILKNRSRGFEILNFQEITGKRGVKKSFETFFNIKLDDFRNDLELIKKNIKIRHRIIHGTLKDENISKQMVKDFRAAIEKFIAYLDEKISSLYLQRVRPMFGVFV